MLNHAEVLLKIRGHIKTHEADVLQHELAELAYRASEDNEQADQAAIEKGKSQKRADALRPRFEEAERSAKQDGYEVVIDPQDNLIVRKKKGADEADSDS